MLSVCDDACREVEMDPTNELMVCKISGHCFGMLLSSVEPEQDPVSRSFLHLSLIMSYLYLFQILSTFGFLWFTAEPYDL